MEFTLCARAEPAPESDVTRKEEIAEKNSVKMMMLLLEGSGV
jgi:hypothetical protein